MKIPSSIKTQKQMETYILQSWCKDQGFDPKYLDGDRGALTEMELQKAFASHISTSGIDSSTFPRYAQIAESYLGIKEVAGTKSNPTILGWIRKWMGYGEDDSKTPWCAIFINECMAQAGIKGTGKANAKSFLKWGVPTNNPRRGDIVVFDRGTKSWQGHVGIYMGVAGSGKIHCLGGNQSDKVSIAAYSISKLRGYRRHN